MDETILRRTWAEIDLDALAHNYHQARARTGPAVRYLGVVKADAYGHGAVQVSRKLEALGADYLAVSSLDEARELVRQLPAACRRHRPATVLLGYAAAPAFFCPLFGGGFWDALSACFCGLVVGACLLFGGKWLGSNGFLRTLVCSGIASLLSLLLVRAGLGSNVDLVTIGVLMLLVPGVALTNAMRELVAGDTYSGLSRTAEAILIAMGIALGSAVGLGIGQIL